MAGRRREPRQVMRYEHVASDPATPETGHTALLPGEEQVVAVPMDNGWVDALDVVRLDGDEPVVIDMDPAVDPVLLWSGKRSCRDVPVLPLQRNEIVSESRIRQIIERARSRAESYTDTQTVLFADLEKELREADKEERVELYTHDESWRNKLICGDSLEVMESLLTYEGLAGAVQMIYMDPPYEIKYNSNFQQRVDSNKNDPSDTADDVLTIKAFHDVWALGVHSYLSFLQERLYLCRELLAATGSVFFQISAEKVHLARAVLDEVFGRSNHISQILFRKTGGLSSRWLNGVGDYLLWYAKDAEQMRYRQLFLKKRPGEAGATQYRFRLKGDGTLEELKPEELAQSDPDEIIAHDNLTSQGNPVYDFEFQGRSFRGPFKPPPHRLQVLAELRRLCVVGNTLRYVRRLSDFPWFEINQLWEDTGVSGFGRQKVYSVQTSDLVVQRCLAMTTDPGDLVLDPTLGSGTTALVAERLGRRWIGIDVARVSINVARRELLGAALPAWRLRGSTLREGFECERTQRITMSSLIDDQEPEVVELVDRPAVDDRVVRVAGPFEVMNLGRYSLESWRGYLVGGDGSEPEKLENYVEVMCRLYRPHAEVGSSSGLLHAIARSTEEEIGISVGPLTGRVTARQILDAATEAVEHGLSEVHVLGWAFDVNVGEEKATIEQGSNLEVRLVMIRPDALAEGLKVTQPETLFSPLALPEIRIESGESGRAVTLDGVGLFDRKTRRTAYHPADDGYIAAWYLDEDYDGDCFVDCQMFFDFKKAPNLKAAAGIEVGVEEFGLRFTSELFEPGEYGRIAVKVVDVYGNESTVVRDL